MLVRIGRGKNQVMAIVLFNSTVVFFFFWFVGGLDVAGYVVSYGKVVGVFSG